jgi:hypothetical protein
VENSDSDRSTPHNLPDVSVGDASTVLLLGSPLDSKTLDAGLSLAARGSLADTRVLWVTLLNTADEVVDLWDGHVPTRPERFRIILVGEGLSGPSSLADPAVETDSVANPGDLTTLGVRLMEVLSVWSQDDVRIHLRFDSLTPILQYVGPRTLVQFLHTLTSRLSAGGVTAQFHLDPMAHDSRTVHALGSICDAQVHVEGDSVSVTTR